MAADRHSPGAGHGLVTQQCGQFLDSIKEDRLYPVYHLAAYWGLRLGELERLEWSDLDLKSRRLHVWGDVKSEDSDRIIMLDEQTVTVLKAWQERQLFEALGPGRIPAVSSQGRTDPPSATVTFPSTTGC